MKDLKLISVLTLSMSTLFSAIAYSAPVNINTANAQNIADNLLGIGYTKAQAVIEYRTTHGKFTDHEQLTRVKGIGIKTVEKNKQDILF